MAGLWHSEPASAATSHDTCRAQLSDITFGHCMIQTRHSKNP